MHIAVLQFDADKGLGLLEKPFVEAGCELTIRLAAREPMTPDFDGLVVLGGIADPAGDEATRAARCTVESALEAGIPVLGICLGAEILALAAGGSTPECDPEFGFREVSLLPSAASDPLLGGLPGAFHVFQAHGFCCAPPPGAVVLAESATGLQGFRVGDRAWGIQFHLEPTIEMVATWVASSPVAATLAQLGLDPTAFVSDAKRYVPTWEQWTHEIGRRFAELSAADRRQPPSARARPGS